MLEALKSLADHTRLRLIGILAHGEFTVQELTEILQMGQSRISRHLKILTEAGILTTRKQGTWSYFRLNGDNEFFRGIRETLLENIDSIAEYRSDQEGVARILDERRRKSQDFFDRHARQWDHLASEIIPVSAYADQLLERIKSPNIAVDIGVGTGRLLDPLADVAQQVIGVDHSASMLDEARKRTSDADLENIELRLGEMTHLPIADAVADCAILNMVLHHAPHPPTVLAEVNRTLQPGGQLLIADFGEHEHEWLRERMADQWLGFARQSLDNWLNEAGFQVSDYIEIEAKDNIPVIFVLSAQKLG